MPNLNDMIDEVLINLAGYTYQQDRATYITENVSDTASTIADPIILQLASTDNIGKGTIEINEELIWLDSFDRVSNTATVPPWGRGYLGTDINEHTAGAKVTVGPKGSFGKTTMTQAKSGMGTPSEYASKAGQASARSTIKAKSADMARAQANKKIAKKAAASLPSNKKR